MKLSSHFALAEFLSPRDPFRPSAAIVEKLIRLAATLELLRVAAGRPLVITSGYRSPIYNAMIGGKVLGYHPKGMAADIGVHDDDEALALLAVASRIPAVGGIGLYPGQGFIHVDLRARIGGRITAWVCRGRRYRPMPEALREIIRARGGRNV